jgi:hypothetical protein
MRHFSAPLLVIILALAASTPAAPIEPDGLMASDCAANPLPEPEPFGTPQPTPKAGCGVRCLMNTYRILNVIGYGSTCAEAKSSLMAQSRAIADARCASIAPDGVVCNFALGYSHCTEVSPGAYEATTPTSLHRCQYYICWVN